MIHDQESLLTVVLCYLYQESLLKQMIHDQESLLAVVLGYLYKESLLKQMIHDQESLMTMVLGYLYQESLLKQMIHDQESLLVVVLLYDLLPYLSGRHSEILSCSYTPLYFHKNHHLVVKSTNSYHEYEQCPVLIAFFQELCNK